MEKCALHGAELVYPEICLPSLISQQVSHTPERTAVKFGSQSLTFGELNSRANQLAHYLRAHGVVADTLVGICVERSIEMVVGLLGILKAGGAYVPLDPTYPAERLAFMLADAKTPLLLTQEKLVKQLPMHDATLLRLDGDWEAVAGYSSENPIIPELTPDHLAYTIYTSGSTGRPKGAMNSHRAIVNRLLWMQDEYQLTENDVVLQKTPFSFDVSVWEFFWPLLAGATMVVAKPEGHKDSSYLIDLIVRENVTVMHFVPSMLSLFLADSSVDRCTSLRDVICSGEALSAAHRDTFFEKLPNANLHNLYGPTEAAIDVTYWQCQRDNKGHTVPIGRPVANTSIHILDENLNPVPAGETGELHIGGVQVARGYWNRPNLTAEKFIDTAYGRLYKSGDLARILPDGTVDFLGRIDFQVKLRGFRIELGEIESAIMRHPNVQEAVVLMREDQPGDKRLVAYVVPSSEVGRADLVERLSADLPDYMIPSQFVFLCEIPLTPNGKRDRKALPTPSRERPDLETAFAEPRDALETYLVRLWQETLDLAQVGIYDRFFELGGSSLQAARVVNKVKERLGEFVYVVSLFEAPTVAAYAAMLRRDYANAVAHHFDVQITTQTVTQIDTVNAKTLDQFKSIIPHHLVNLKSKIVNPQAVFILAPPRSGTTLLRVMLAGNKELFSSAELQLLNFDTLSGRRAAFQNKFTLWQEGTVRAIMEALDISVAEAWELMADAESRHDSTATFYGELQAMIAPRILVEKTPAYALERPALQRAEQIFDKPLYIHLVRHPAAMVKSFVNNHIAPVLYLKKHNFSDRALGELNWLHAHRTIREFLGEISAERQHRIQFEQMVADPATVMRDLCAHFGWQFDPEMAQPYQNTERKMVDGIHADSTPMGDSSFLERNKIDPTVATRWQQDAPDLSPLTLTTAAELGYTTNRRDARRARRMQRR